ncbi:hypothetical protein NsoK4_00685 [Nitrosopumilus sp. K4]|uniref:hypothetical protein n=1 Tax=Nitrosopumilus sp. K4 TaxID=2795383 RepID=UPI001BA6F039|nr:hypothetical protein [Nitrosopumilus sp. K4]QUC64835.1 hypothetical protein NsoK4_00685 [Nitrosopumilus sp. K4]
MSDPLFDDVKELLDKEKGDERILKQILRACENNEVVSNYERNYVRKLAEKHLGRKPVFEKKIEEKDEKPSAPDVVIPKPTEIPQPQILQTQPKVTKPKNQKMMLGIVAAALVAIIIIGVAASELPVSTTDVAKPTSSATNLSFSIDTDSNSYQKKDIISISGVSKSSDYVNLTIENQDGILVWSEQVKTKNDGRYSTLAIAGGTGWEKSGTFTLKAENDSEIISKPFSFTS